MNPIMEVMESWKAEAEKLEERYGDFAGAAICRAHVKDLRHALTDFVHETLNLTDAAERCGYSADHLGRMIRDGKLKNYGRKNAPQLRAVDLPRKPGHLSYADAAQAKEAASREPVEKKEWKVA
jgi:hypothetical protein